MLSYLGIGNHLLTDALSLGTVFSSTDSVAALQVGLGPPWAPSCIEGYRLHGWQAARLAQHLLCPVLRARLCTADAARGARLARRAPLPRTCARPPLPMAKLRGAPAVAPPPALADS